MYCVSVVCGVYECVIAESFQSFDVLYNICTHLQLFLCMNRENLYNVL